VTADPTPASWPARVRLVIFTAAVLLSAALLFVVQPMFARMVLPMMGGTPATWTTCLLFFQVTLLAGYLYVHLTSTRLTGRAQAVVHLALLLTVVAVSPLMAPPPAAAAGVAPTVWLVTTLASCVGLPFLAVSGTAPLLQRWYAGATGRDPYFLYAASNLGSLVGLLGYPLVVERTLTLAGQRSVWMGGFAVLALLIATCAAAVWRTDPATPLTPAADRAADVAITGGDRLRWLVLALVPSSLLLGVTTHISTDVAAVPLLWVVPLALYLGSFILAFAAPPPIPQHWVARLTPVAIVVAVIARVVGTSWWVGLAVHLTAFAVVALAFHRELSDRRPGPAGLTQYFLIISVGGAVGGLVNAVVAPLVFTSVAEYPLMLAVAAALRPAPGWRGGRAEPAALVLGVPLVVFAVLTAVWTAGLAASAGAGANATGFWLAAAVALVVTNRRPAFAVAVGFAVTAHLALERPESGRILFAARSFFGVHRVLENDDRTMHRLTHGTTLHGWQRLGTGRCEPTSYYHPDGPIGQLFREGRTGAGDVAVIGLGAGGLACYAPAGSRWTFLEIDPLVERIARDPALFTFLTLSPGQPRVVIGDGRLRLRELPAGSLDTVVIDAFSSDAVPVHLLTREFVALALERVRVDGRVVFHISNRYLDLAPVVAAAAASLGAHAFEQAYAAAHPDAVASRWLVVGRPQAVTNLAADTRWRAPAAGGRMWTDDFSDILDVVAWDPRQAMPVVAR
jgi:hypothetical protein